MKFIFAGTNHKEWERNNFPIAITVEYSTTGIAGGYMMDGAPESTHQPVQPLGGNYCDLVLKHSLLYALYCVSTNQINTVYDR